MPMMAASDNAPPAPAADDDGLKVVGPYFALMAAFALIMSLLAPLSAINRAHERDDLTRHGIRTTAAITFNGPRNCGKHDLHMYVAFVTRDGRHVVECVGQDPLLQQDFSTGTLVPIAYDPADPPYYVATRADGSVPSVDISHVWRNWLFGVLAVTAALAAIVGLAIWQGNRRSASAPR